MLPIESISSGQAALGAALVALAIGTVLGCTGRITVFRDTSDLFVTFALLAGWGVCSWFGLGLTSDRAGKVQPTLLAISAVVFATMLFFIALRAWADNRTVVKTLLAVLTKIPYAIFVPLLAIQVIAPTGNTAAKRASGRAGALFLLTIIGPLLIALTRDKTAFTRITRGSFLG